jgi:hypothetical protein
MPRSYLPLPGNDRDRLITHHRDCSAVTVLPWRDPIREPSSALSVGLFEAFRHPELIVLGMAFYPAGRLVEVITEAVTKGQRMHPGRLFQGLHRTPVAFLPVDPRHFGRYLGAAVCRFGGHDFPLLQCVLPVSSGQFPWDLEYDPKEAANQPLLGDVPPMAVQDPPPA